MSIRSWGTVAALARCSFASMLLILAACQSSNHKEAAPDRAVLPLRKFNVVLVTIDTLRSDRLGCYGYRGIETPNLDKLAKEGVLFENAIAQAPLTGPSHASMFTGMYPPVHKVRDTGGFVLHPSNMTLAEILQQQGWDTAAFVGASVLKKAFGFDQGFTVYDDQMPKPSDANMAVEFPERRAGEVVDRAIRWLDMQSGKPFFLWVHVFDPHSPYDAPSPLRESYVGRAYDGEVAYTDQQLGRLFETIARKSPSKTLLAVLADHGESLSEHGEYTHGIFLYDATLRIPFIMAGPGVPSGLRVKQQARTVDLLPTLLELMGSKAPERVQGTSLTPAFAGKKVVTGEAYVETLFPKINMGWTELQGMRTDRWKYIRAPKPELYDLVQDPAELTNLIDSHPKEAQELEAKLKSVLGDSRNGKKVQTTMADPRTLQQLKSLGYLGGSSEPEYALTGRGIDPKDRVEVLRLLYLAVSPDARESTSRRLPLLRQAIAMDPANPMIYYYLGDEFGRVKRHREAINLYEDGLRKGLKNAWLFSRLGHLYLRQGDRDKAISAYERAAQLNPSDSESMNDLGMIYLETGKLADAERVFKWSVAADQTYALAYNGLGLVSIQKQDLAAARVHFEKAAQLDPNLLEAQLNLGRIYKIMGANTRAKGYFEAFLAKAPPAQYGPIIAKVKEELATMQ